MPKSRELKRRPSGRLRCAIYTRKSSEERLEQSFNSLDAQREACAAFIVSQKHEGWSLLPTLYDDGGYSGGTLDRPALQRLLADIADGTVDVVVVYKIDRLTRSLFDFAKIVEVFEARRVSFVSITQQFNTTTSMGRLTLNVLLSFAQFEREVAGERIRDKIAASKKKGMWMGGLPPLGYEVRDRKLVTNEEEARTVLDIFRRYVDLRSVRALKAELDARGIRSKCRTFADGTNYGGHKLSRGALYLMLQNRIYRGDITHKGSAYPGEHKAIVDQALWDNVQAVLAENRVNRTLGGDSKHPSLLAGLAFDDSGERLTPTHAVKKGTRYRYYVSKSLITGAAKDHSQGRRIPAGNLENLVIGRLRDFLGDEGAVLSAIRDEEQNGAQQKRLITRGRQISDDLPTLTPDLVRSFLMMLVNRVDIKAERVEIRVYRQRLHDLLRAQTLEQPSLAPAATGSDDILKLTVTARLQRVGREMKLIVHNADDRATADPGLLRIVARAHDFQERLMRDTDLTVPAIAGQERLTIGYLSRLLRLPSLAPDIVTAIINGKHPPELSAKRLMRLALKLPTDWDEQRRLLGFQRQ
ncbi:recombinase family protein [Methyloceanibacter sp.]|uniref:recombinase family protein n=1 Tax=Methyloceanibacter sp. TaxID=1965321 RepID=UPI0020810E8A|nr:recombinase family protein [Methyloceanibacter sp.]GFO82095.1 MAG: integrase [Methyloceanibacter sp.]HML90856.1 recombinase family protein [Methyloceanibacter sp.]